MRDLKPETSAASVETRTGRVDVSIVIPLFNEEDNIRPLYLRLKRVLADTGLSYELIFVDDGSTDSTLERILHYRETDNSLTVLKLSGNYGQTPALAAGFDHATGEIIISMDGDLQHAPEDIPRFLEKMREGFTLVSGWREKRKDPFLSRRLPSAIANWLMRRLSGVDVHDFGTTYKAYRRNLLDDLVLYGDFHRFIPVLLKEKKAKIAEIPIRNSKREKGKSNYNITRTFTVFFDLIRLNFLTRFLSNPLQLFGSFGLLLAFSGMATSVYLVYLKYAFGLGLLEYRAPLFILSIMLMVVGSQFLTLGLLGEIMVKIYHSSGKGKIYSVQEIHKEV